MFIKKDRVLLSANDDMIMINVSLIPKFVFVIRKNISTTIFMIPEKSPPKKTEYPIFLKPLNTSEIIICIAKRVTHSPISKESSSKILFNVYLSINLQVIIVIIPDVEANISVDIDPFVSTLRSRLCSFVEID
jgi:hypothetical protein